MIRLDCAQNFHREYEPPSHLISQVSGDDVICGYAQFGLGDIDRIRKIDHSGSDVPGVSYFIEVGPVSLEVQVKEKEAEKVEEMLEYNSEADVGEDANN